MTMAKQISKVTRAAKDSQGTKKRTGRRPTYVLTLSDEDKEFLASVIAKRSARSRSSCASEDSPVGQ
ncbi:hypothetical protein [Ferrimicrobium acidiphilum]|uniref:Uncharacterized protein n=1 Tax=Ferrimicrobium acidiphilum DSM 19497 TaxID=1121877 RepID=A0A0D8FQW8_9ACTN|nr:hypothetical protein [Ferrimicrobium acidiphilum]KJE75344.1 hypothetical protein FEAC_29160 [Ferrimicrobium acidiphilum DSM 19497]